MARVPDELLPVIKYAAKSGEHNDVLRRQFEGSPIGMYEASHHWREDLKGEFQASVEHVPHELEAVYGVPIRLDCYLVGPLPLTPAGG